MKSTNNKMPKIPLLLLAGLTASAPCSSASIMLTLSVDLINDAAGSPVSTSTGSWLLIADTTGNGFNPITAGSTTINNFLGGDDLVIAKGDFTTFGTPGIITAAPASLSFNNGWNQGDSLALVWFPEGGTARTSTQAGDAYGLYTSTTGQDSSDPWITPADGTTDHSLRLVSDNALGFFGTSTAPVAASTLNANLQVVPEPSSTALLGLGTLGLLIRRKR